MCAARCRGDAADGAISAPHRELHWHRQGAGGHCRAAARAWNACERRLLCAARDNRSGAGGLVQPGRRPDQRRGRMPNCGTRGGIGRAPGFAFQTLDEACAFVAWLRHRPEELAAVAAQTSRYCRLLDTRTRIEGNHVYVNFEFATGDAAGQNMVTFASEALMQHIEQHSPVQPRYAFIEVNHSGDKKASARALQGVRGRRVVAEVTIPADDVRNTLHTDPKCMAEYWRMGAIGCALSGTTGIQGQYANALAAIYLACGQDVACVAESATGITRFELTEDRALYAAVTLPNVLVGTVGGGTSLPSQRASLAIMGLEGPGNAGALAEICAAACLSGELSLVGALCAGEFARAHRNLARPMRAPESIPR